MNNVLTRKFNPELLIEDFIEDCQKFVELYSCPLCEGILIEAIIDRCGHSFCKKCIEIVKTETNKCPFSKIEIKDYLVNNVVNSVIEKQVCYCKNKHLKCDWQGKLSDRKDHLYYDCTKENIKCENDKCEIRVLRESLNEHMLGCEFRKITCHHCKNIISYNELEIHYQSCPKVPVICPNDCGLEIPNCELAKHLEILCENSIGNCPFKQIGCDFVDMRKSIKVHLEEYLETHLKLINEKIMYLQEQINHQNTEIESLKQENKELRNNLDTTNLNINNNYQDLALLINNLSQNFEQFKLYSNIPKSNYIPNFFTDNNENNNKIFSLSKEKKSISKEIGDNAWYGILSAPIEVSSDKLILNFKILKTQNSCIMFGISFSEMKNPVLKGSYQQMDNDNLSFMFYCYNSSIYSKARSHKYGNGMCSEGDVITIIIDFINRCILFRKNGNYIADHFNVSLLEKAENRRKMRFALDMCEYKDEIIFLD